MYIESIQEVHIVRCLLYLNLYNDASPLSIYIKAVKLYLQIRIIVSSRGRTFCNACWNSVVDLVTTYMRVGGRVNTLVGNKRAMHFGVSLFFSLKLFMYSLLVSLHIIFQKKIIKFFMYNKRQNIKALLSEICFLISRVKIRQIWFWPYWNGVTLGPGLSLFLIKIASIELCFL